MKLGRWRRGSADSSCRSGGRGKRRDQEPLLNGSLSEVGGPWCHQSWSPPSPCAPGSETQHRERPGLGSCCYSRHHLGLPSSQAEGWPGLHAFAVS